MGYAAHHVNSPNTEYIITMSHEFCNVFVWNKIKPLSTMFSTQRGDRTIKQMQFLFGGLFKMLRIVFRGNYIIVSVVVLCIIDCFAESAASVLVIGRICKSVYNFPRISILHALSRLFPDVTVWKNDIKITFKISNSKRNIVWICIPYTYWRL